MTKHVLFVCIGNICRSPLAAAIMRRYAQDAGLVAMADSAASAGWHSGEPADARAIVAGRGHGLDLTAHKARPLRAEDFEKVDLIVAMDQESLEAATFLAPAGSDVEVTLMRRFASEPSEADIPDPYYTGQFEPLIALLDDCMPGLIAYLNKAQ